MNSEVASKGERIVYLDALRAFCMFYGILSHGGSLDHDGNLFLLVIKVFSDLFRMATFFLIAGYFTSMVASKSTGAAYVKGRMILILIPLVTTLVTLIPITNYLIFIWHNGPMSLYAYFWQGGWALTSLGKNVWFLHLWFLFCLFFYAMATPAALGLFRLPAVNQAIANYVERTGRFTLWTNFVIIGLIVLAMRFINVSLVSPIFGGTRAEFILRSTLNYAPYYMLGVAMFVNAPLFRSMHKISIIGMIASAAMFMLARYGGYDMPVIANRLLLWTGKSGAIVFIIAALLRIFELKFSRPSKALSFCVDGAFTFYLFHLTGIYVVANLVKGLIDGNVMAAFFIVVVTVPPAVLLLHARVVRPSPLLRLLYNGRITKRVSPAATI